MSNGSTIRMKQHRIGDAEEHFGLDSRRRRRHTHTHMALVCMKQRHDKNIRGRVISHDAYTFHSTGRLALAYCTQAQTHIDCVCLVHTPAIACHSAGILQSIRFDCIRSLPIYSKTPPPPATTTWNGMLAMAMAMPATTAASNGRNKYFFSFVFSFPHKLRMHRRYE